ncbi:glycosyltransferase [Patescibacteria group bacterium]|nr:glycosyltransferase [Patescibacteria group bacterium]
MKVCLINSLYKPFLRGGAEVVVENIARGLAHQGDHVVLITLGVKDEVEEIDGIKIYRIASRNIFSFIDINSKPFLLRLPWHVIDMLNIFSARAVTKILQKENPEIVFTHNIKGLSYLIPRTIKKLGIKHVHTIHDVQLSVPSGLMIKGQENLTILIRLYQNLTKILFGSPSIVISPSKWLMDFYQSMGFFKKSTKIVLPNPIVATEQVESNNVEQNKINFLFLGQVEKQKGIIFLVEVFKKLDPKLYHLNIAGEGSMVMEVGQKTKHNNNIHILGKIQQEDLSSTFSQNDLLIMPSLCYENSPMVIGEALSHGVPVIATNIGGAAELIKTGLNGYMFEPGDEQGLLELLKSINKDKLTSLKKQARSSVENYSLQHYLNKILVLE